MICIILQYMLFCLSNYTLVLRGGFQDHVPVCNIYAQKISHIIRFNNIVLKLQKLRQCYISCVKGLSFPLWKKNKEQYLFLIGCCQESVKFLSLFPSIPDCKCLPLIYDLFLNVLHSDFPNSVSEKYWCLCTSGSF